ARQHAALSWVGAVMTFSGAESGGPGVVLRVPRASRSSFTCAKRPGHPVLSDGLAPIAVFMSLAAMGMGCLSQRGKGGADRRSAGDMSGGRHPMPMAGTAIRHPINNTPAPL